MSAAAVPSKIVTKTTVLRLLTGWGVTVVFATGAIPALHHPTGPIAALAFAVILSAIVTASFGVVREADHLAHRLGEPYGTLILTLSIVSIEVILIAAVLLGPGEAPTIGRDAIFAVMMIILNLVMGLCILLGGHRYGEQEYNAQGAIAYLQMTALLVGMALVLPNYIGIEGKLLPAQKIAFSALTVLVYAIFLVMQMRGLKRLFGQPEKGALWIPFVRVASETPRLHATGGRGEIVARSLLLVVMVLPIVLLSHDLAGLMDLGIEALGAPVALSGLLIAIIVFLPESLTAVRAALADEMQRAVNLCLGAFVSTVGLTVPAVLIIGLAMGKTVTMGISPANTMLLALTLLVSMLTFQGQRTVPIQGIIHLILFAVFVVALLTG